LLGMRHGYSGFSESHFTTFPPILSHRQGICLWKRSFFLTSYPESKIPPQNAHNKGPVRPSATANHVRTQRGARSEPRTSSRHPNAQNEDINFANDRRAENGTGQLHAHSTIVAITLAHSRSQPGAACFGAVETLGINNARARNARRIVFVFAKLRLDVTRDKSIRIDFHVVHLPFPFCSIPSQTRPSESPATRPVPANHKPSLFLLFLSLPTKKS